jgi:DNA-directed RNA polymerase sigma subunit (sigma70/sigma32)
MSMQQIPDALSAALARERAAAMHSLLRRGFSLAEIADIYEISRERVRQLVAKHFPEYRARRGRPRKEADEAAT